MDFRSSSLWSGALVVATLVAMSSESWAHWYDLGPSRDGWGVKYAVEVDTADAEKVTVHFTLADQGRLTPIHSVFIMALSNPDRGGSRTYLLKTRVTMQQNTDGTLTGQVEVSRKFADRAAIRIFTYTVDGRSQMAGPMGGARYYDIPLNQFLKQARSAAATESSPAVASPPASRVAR